MTKWVDYTNKFGLGYILNTGDVGCVFRALSVDPSDPSRGYTPPTCVMVRKGERHLHNRGNKDYTDRHQILPISGPNVEFYENRGVEGIFRGKVNPQNYKVGVDQNGEVERLARGRDEWDDRKRERIVLWKKFANYMTAYGRDADYPYDDALRRTSPERVVDITASGDVVTFYQRLGDVGCWIFNDGHLQVSTIHPILASLLTVRSLTSRITQRSSYPRTAPGVISMDFLSKRLVISQPMVRSLHPLLMTENASLTLFKRFSTS